MVTMAAARMFDGDRLLGARPAKRRNESPFRAVHGTRLQQPGLPRDERKPESEQGRQGTEQRGTTHRVER